MEVLEINPGTKVGTETAENFINKTLTKEQIICFESKVTAEGNVTKKVRWGPYADQSVSKRDLLQFYSEVFSCIYKKKIFSLLGFYLGIRWYGRYGLGSK